MLKPGFLLPPLMFSAQEIEALALGLQWVGRRTDEGMGQAARNVMAKVAAVLPADLRERMEDDALVVGHGWDRPQPRQRAVRFAAMPIYTDRASWELRPTSPQLPIDDSC